MGEAVGRVREAVVGAQANQEVPFEKLVEALNPERDLSRQPLFQVMFAMQQEAGAGAGLAGVEMEVMKLDGRTAKFDLLMSVGEERGGYSGSVEYSSDLFDEQSIRRLIGQYEKVVEAMADGPEQRVSRVRMQSEWEREMVLRGWNETSRERGEQVSVQAMIERQVEVTPEARAVVCGDEEVSYEELKRRANQVAHYLIGLGIKSEGLVGICMRRGVDLVVAMVGVLKSGGAYVPLDPAYPRARLSYMLEDARISVLITERDLKEIFPPHVKTVCLDEQADEIASHSSHNPAVEVSPSNLAYVIYTSGSTGRPKGVAMQHGARWRC